MGPVERIRSKVVVLPHDDIDTDQILPARYLKTTDKLGLAEGLFAGWRYDEQGSPRPDFVLNRPEMAGRQLLLAGANFGSGSSREHAPWALHGFGFRAVLARSFADIFRANALKNGLLPVELDASGHARLADLLAADPDAEVVVDLVTSRVELPGGPPLPFSIDPFSRTMLLEGTDELGYLLAQSDHVAAYEASHPGRVDTALASG